MSQIFEKLGYRGRMWLESDSHGSFSFSGEYRTFILGPRRWFSISGHGGGDFVNGPLRPFPARPWWGDSYLQYYFILCDLINRRLRFWLILSKIWGSELGTECAGDRIHIYRTVFCNMVYYQLYSLVRWFDSSQSWKILDKKTIFRISFKNFFCSVSDSFSGDFSTENFYILRIF